MVDSLKKRRKGVSRAVQVPPTLLRHPRPGPGFHREPETAQKTRARSAIVVLVPHHRLATCGRSHDAGGHHCGSPHRVPKSLRHGDTMHAVQKGVPLPRVSKEMSHSLLAMTALSANAVGQEQQAIASHLWP
jgi:hypothetical protein